MSEKMMENNKVSVIGEIVSGFTFSHEVFGEGFYMVSVAVNRLSEQVDVIPLMISERLLDVDKNYEGCTVEAIGQFRSYNRHEGTKTVWCCRCSCGRSIFWRNLQTTPRRTRSIWTAISARNRYTGKLLWEGRSPIFCWR